MWPGMARDPALPTVHSWREGEPRRPRFSQAVPDGREGRFGGNRPSLSARTDLLREPEVGDVVLAVGCLDVQGSARIRPTLVGLPDVVVLVAQRIVVQAALPSRHCLLDRIR